MNLMALAVPLVVGDERVLANFLGGVTFRVLDSRRLEVTGFHAQAHHGDRWDGLGTITLKQQGVVTSLLRPTRSEWEHTLALEFTVTIERPPQELLRRAGLLPTSRRPEPISLSTKDATVLVGKWNNVPADGATYGLRRTIPLVMAPGAQTVASIDRLPLQIARAV